MDFTKIKKCGKIILKFGEITMVREKVRDSNTTDLVLQKVLSLLFRKLPVCSDWPTCGVALNIEKG